MAILVIPDVHHAWEWVRQITHRHAEEIEHIVLLGDYLDNNVEGRLTHRESLEALMRAIREFGPHATFLCGNHDVQYIHPLGGGCSGRNAEFAAYMETAPEAAVLRQTLKAAAHVHGYLCTHAGLAPFSTLRAVRGTHASAYAQYLNEQWAALMAGEVSAAWLLAVGRANGGSALASGPLWHRPWETDLEAVNQICGHTHHAYPQRKTTYTSGWDSTNMGGEGRYEHWYIDTGQRHYLLVRAHEVEVYGPKPEKMPTT